MFDWEINVKLIFVLVVCLQDLFKPSLYHIIPTGENSYVFQIFWRISLCDCVKMIL